MIAGYQWCQHLLTFFSGIFKEFDPNTNCWSPVSRFNWYKKEYRNVIGKVLFVKSSLSAVVCPYKRKKDPLSWTALCKDWSINLSGQFIHLPKQGPAIRCRIFRVKTCLSSIISVSLSINSHSRNKRYATAKTVNGRRVWLTASCVPNTRNNDETKWCCNWNGPL